jgi:hypothetical protein
VPYFYPGHEVYHGAGPGADGAGNGGQGEGGVLAYAEARAEGGVQGGASALGSSELYRPPGADSHHRFDSAESVPEPDGELGKQQL